MSRSRKFTTIELLAALAALSHLPTVHAYCYIDGFGFERCTLGSGARAGIAIAILVLAIALLVVGLMVRKRRTQRANLAYIHQPPIRQGFGPNANQSAYQQNPHWQGSNVQYPPQTYAYPPYDPSTGFAPPQEGAPPSYYPSPNGPPPGNGKEAV
ncbi:hypothetical protein NLI96_g9371 [Meripilus lineatus]|uniref:Uncharacterized protein n=1 Tax=Meripilus lineatus TaxID=2056292 RepID=A0AAD5YB51_9APHY|nr:hypothetical protein NLI96_g9371 [Physisporinus lineatus]